MQFNSPEFLLFLPLVFALYWGVFQSHLRAQNALLLAASYVFYGWWDWRFLGLIAFSTLVDYAVALAIERAGTRRKARAWLAVSLAVNLGLLGYFKYANFFVENWIAAWAQLGIQMDLWSVQVILPVGISFYTFQTLSYSIDVYRGELKPTRDPLAFAAFVSFFPQLVAGPIERAKALLPQIEKPRKFRYEEGVTGLRLILWGLFKKVVVADSCAVLVDAIFGAPDEVSGLTLILGAIYFAFQIYGDFSGYSDIAIGTARLFGIRLMTNFRMPYFSRDIAEFWRRWHISLSTWFRDYLYIPLGGSRVSRGRAVRNTFVIFLVSGFWHGANWTFIAWGGIHALLFLPLLVTGRNRKRTGDQRGMPSLRDLLGMAWTFSAVTVAWVFFRAASISEAWNYLTGMLRPSTPEAPTAHVDYTTIAYVVAMVAVDFLLLQVLAEHRLLSQRWRPVRWLTYVVGSWFVWKHFANQGTFIYFQF